MHTRGVEESMAGPSQSTGAMPDTPVPSNVCGIYVAEFLPREGNAIIHTYPSDLPVEGFEWKVLPSGGHEVRSDVIHFESGVCEEGVLFNVAAFRARRFSPEEIEQDTLNRRGARLVAVGITLGTCPRLTQCAPRQIQEANCLSFCRTSSIWSAWLTRL